ncbi:MAG: hypothetical protein HC835_01020 [Oscillatoriales cyanobacterium RM2_1_1]|nr:hypothetical protein [Oscillatoriales cyanobacterium SM2_3_0]NJO44320.1 hypothetical protein [Oscillatoriales cyanobacterium RM2_1_1]
MMNTLSNLLQPYPVEQFLHENWAQQGILISGNQPSRFDHLFSWHQFNHLLNFHRLREPQLRFVLDQKDMSFANPQEGVRRCKAGASIVLSRVNELVPQIADLIWSLQEDLGHRKIHANVYCSWPGHQGFHCHYDTHEVFILQLEGEKEWFVFEDTLKYPYRQETWDSREPPKSEPYIHSVLKPGDLLYIPRGHWHYAIAQNQPSLHLTIGVLCLKGADLLTWLAETLQQPEIWRKNLPLFSQGETEPLEEYTRRLIDHLVGTLQAEKQHLSQEFARVHRMQGFRDAEVSLPMQVGFGLFAQELNTPLRLAQFLKVRLEPLPEGSYQLVAGDKTVTFKQLPPEFVKQLMEFVLSGQIFTPNEIAQKLPNYSLDTVIIPILAGLIKEGVLIEDDPIYTDRNRNQIID